jgi:hypothetical protein
MMLSEQCGELDPYCAKPFALKILPVSYCSS